LGLGECKVRGTREG